MTEQLTYDTFLKTAIADPAVVGLVLIGSHAHEGLATERSDHDLWVVLDDEVATDLVRLTGHRTATLDLVIQRLKDFRTTGVPPYMRYGLGRGKVVLDRLDGDIAAILAAKAELSEEEAFSQTAEGLDGYMNLLYRSLKNDRDGHRLAARLDAADSIGWLLETLFAMDRRPKPYNKYLEWELERYPLPDWETDALLEAIGHISVTADVDAQRQLFAEVEQLALREGHRETLDGWGDDILMMRPRPSGT